VGLGRPEVVTKGALHLRIDTAGGVPIYLQIINQVKYHIVIEALKADDELPSVRAVAGEYLINPNTVARAYLELEREEIIYKKRGMGTYVAEKGVDMSTEEKLQIVGELLDKALVQGVQLGLDPESLRRVFDETLKKFSSEQ
jgi:GntR family transcriptional regulator